MRERIVKQTSYVYKSVEYLLLLYTALFTLYSSFAELYAKMWFERLEAIVGVVITIIMIYKLFTLEKKEKLKWLKSSILVIVYFVFRTCSFIESGFDYSVARTVFFEGIYLIVISGYIINSQFCKCKIMKLFVFLNFILNAINVCNYFILTYCSNLQIIRFIKEYTAFTFNNNSASSMYMNPNTFGIMTALAIIIALNLISNIVTTKYKLTILAYIVFSLYCVHLSECRSAQLSLFVVAVCWSIVEISKKRISGKTLVISVLTLTVVTTGILYGFMHKNINTGLYNFTNGEIILDNMSSGRYFIWKSGYYAQSDNMLFGTGSLSKELSDRNLYVCDDIMKNNYETISYVYSNLGPHNGYLAMIYCTGILGFLAFMAVLLQKILEAKSLRYGGWYLAVIFFMSVNMFETMTIVSRFFVCLLTFIILAMDNNDDEHGYELERSDEAKLL